MSTMNDRKRVWALAAAAGLFLSACSVDLERSEAVLGLFIDGAGDTAQEVVIEVDDQLGQPPFVSRFTLTDAAREAGPPAFALPDISVATGTVVVTARTFDSASLVVDGPRRETIELVPGRNGLTIDFMAPEVVRTESPPANGGGAEQSSRQVSASVVVQTEPSGNTLTLELAVSAIEWAAALTAFEADLQSSPASLVIQQVSVISEDAGDEAPSLDELWSGTVTVDVVGASVDASVYSFAAPSANQVQSAVAAVDVTAWRALPSDARVVLSGTLADDDVDTPFALRVSLDILATR